LIYTKFSQKYSSKQELICPWPQPLLRTAGQQSLCTPFLTELVPLVLQPHVTPFLLKEFAEESNDRLKQLRTKNS